ncbi:MAG: helix-turn-helix domain-containing protein [Pseudoxanthomonas sp.]
MRVKNDNRIMNTASGPRSRHAVRTGSLAHTVEVGLLLYPRYHPAMVHGMTDLLGVASGFSVARGGPPLRITHWSMDSAGAIARCHDTHPGTGRNPDVLIAPAIAPGLTHRLLDHDEVAPFARWLAERHAEGATLASSGCGAFVLAATGLMSGRSMTTHWSKADQLQASFPDTKVDASKVIIEDGDILSAGGMMAWADLGLRLIDRILGPTIMIEAAQFFLIDPAGREQRHYSTFTPRLAHGDETILKVQHKLQADPARSITVPDLAREVSMEQRTFLRRFKAATHMTPTEYVQHLRIGKVREHLQFTNDPIDRIAWAIGYSDVAAFRRLFVRIVGVSPSEYRRRFKTRNDNKSFDRSA